jgi:UDP-glucose 4-epimerase
MKILLTGGSGDLGTVLAPQLTQRGDTTIIFDLRPPQTQTAVYHPGSILDRDQLTSTMSGLDVVVHIAAWHGIHEVRGEKDVYDFWDLNVTGTLYVLETAVRANIQNIVHISSTSVDEWPGIYGSSKIMAEDLVRTYAARHGLNAIILRPRAFIPYWKKTTYASYVEWAKWFWKGAVHINDVAQATCQSIDLLTRQTFDTPPALVVDGAYDFSSTDLDDWDADGPGSTFARVYPEYTDLVVRYELDSAAKPRPLDISETRRLLGYKPQYSLRHLLQELDQFGLAGPPVELG